MSAPASRIGVLDSGFAGPAFARRGFAEIGAPPTVAEIATPTPRCDHGALIAALLREGGPLDLQLLDAQIFGAQLRCRPYVAAAGLEWLIVRGATLINMSWGLVDDHPALRSAVERARAAGVWIVAATPIRGAAPYPARYPEVISVSGDARCAEGEFSDFRGPPADFGASPEGGPRLDARERQTGPRGGSSFACARVSAALACALREEPGSDPRDVLRQRAQYHGSQTPPG